MDEQTAAVIVAAITAAAGIVTAVVTRTRRDTDEDLGAESEKAAVDAVSGKQMIPVALPPTPVPPGSLMSIDQAHTYVSRSDEALLRGWERLLDRLQNVVHQQAEELTRTQERNDELREMVDQLHAQSTADKESIRLLRLKLDESERDLTDAIRRIAVQEAEITSLKLQIETRRRTSG